LFEGTVKDNLDPYSQLTTQEIEATLVRFGITNLQSNQPVTVLGGNLSLGEKQLLVLVRAVLQAREIVILDECTGSLDEQYSKQLNDVLAMFLKVVTYTY
jgi:ATP-binding cassette subfamily C (CFTR/MRP) protein 4